MLTATAQKTLLAEARQYSVLIPNQPGRLERLTALLARAGVNVSGIASVDVGSVSWLKFLAEPAGGLRIRLEHAGFKMTESRVFLAQADDEPDFLHRLACELGRLGINIISCYGSVVEGSAKLVLTVDRPELAGELCARE